MGFYMIDDKIVEKYALEKIIEFYTRYYIKDPDDYVKSRLTCLIDRYALLMESIKENEERSKEPTTSDS